MTWLIFMAASLGCFRLTRLITDDGIFDWLRRDVSKAGKKAAEGIRCPFCVSFYYSTIITVGLWYVGLFTWPWILFWQPAVWGASIIFNQIFMKLSK